MGFDEANFEVPNVVPSMNTDQVRGWRSFARLKKLWQAELEQMLLSLGLPRPLPAAGPLYVDAVLRFKDRRRRDSENYRVLLSKALGDALVNGGWIPDDTDDDWRLQVRIDRNEVGEPRTLIQLRWVPIGGPRP
jgi:hypothetical protein